MLIWRIGTRFYKKVGITFFLSVETDGALSGSPESITWELTTFQSEGIQSHWTLPMRNHGLFFGQRTRFFVCGTVRKNRGMRITRNGRKQVAAFLRGIYIRGPPSTRISVFKSPFDERFRYFYILYTLSSNKDNRLTSDEYVRIVWNWRAFFQYHTKNEQKLHLRGIKLQSFFEWALSC